MSQTTLQQILTILNNSKTGDQLPVALSISPTDSFLIFSESNERIERTQKSITDAFYILNTEKGAASGVVPLNSSSKIDSIYLPSYVDDVLEGAYINSTTFNDTSGNPYTPESGKIYLDISGGAEDSNQFRWTGSVYFQITNQTAEWGSIGGTLSNQTDLVNEFLLKANITGAAFTGPISTTSSVTATQFIGNGSQLTNLNVNAIDLSAYAPKSFPTFTGDVKFDSFRYSNSLAGITLKNNGGSSIMNIRNAAGALILDSVAEDTFDIKVLGSNKLQINTSGILVTGTATATQFTGNGIGLNTTDLDTLHGVDYGTTQIHIDGLTDRGQMIIEGDTFAQIVMSDNSASVDSRVFSQQVNDGVYSIKSLNDDGTSGSAEFTITHAGLATFNGKSIFLDQIQQGTSTSSNTRAMAFGFGTSSSGLSSVSLGDQTTASGNSSIATGISTIASGEGSSSFGIFNYSRAKYETSIGMFGTDYTPTDTNTDRLFNVGNGIDASNRSNVFTITRKGDAFLQGDFNAHGSMSLDGGSGDFVSRDGSTGATGTFNDGDGNVITIKNGIITQI